MAEIQTGRTLLEIEVVSGAHMSIAGGIHLAFDRLDKIRGTPCRFLPLTTGGGFRANSDATAIELFKSRWEQSGWIPVAAHDTYLINLAATDR